MSDSTHVAIVPCSCSWDADPHDCWMMYSESKAALPALRAKQRSRSSWRTLARDQTCVVGQKFSCSGHAAVRLFDVLALAWHPGHLAVLEDHESSSVFFDRRGREGGGLE